MPFAIARSAAAERQPGTGEDEESTEELAARLKRIQAAASFAEGDVDSDTDSEQVLYDAPVVSPLISNMLKICP